MKKKWKFSFGKLRARIAARSCWWLHTIKRELTREIYWWNRHGQLTFHFSPDQRSEFSTESKHTEQVESASTPHWDVEKCFEFLIYLTIKHHRHCHTTRNFNRKNGKRGSLDKLEFSFFLASSHPALEIKWRIDSLSSIWMIIFLGAQRARNGVGKDKSSSTSFYHWFFTIIYRLWGKKLSSFAFPKPSPVLLWTFWYGSTQLLSLPDTHQTRLWNFSVFWNFWNGISLVFALRKIVAMRERSESYRFSNCTELGERGRSCRRDACLSQEMRVN